MSIQGKVLEVSKRPTGSVLTADVDFAAQVIDVEDTSEFPDTNDGLLYLNDAFDDPIIWNYTAILNETQIEVPNTSWNSLEGEFVGPYPPSFEKVAMVDTDTEDDVVLATVPNALYSQLVDGVRQEEDQETVIVEIDDQGEWVVVDIVGEEGYTTDKIVLSTGDSREDVAGSVEVFFDDDGVLHTDFTNAQKVGTGGFSHIRHMSNDADSWIEIIGSAGLVLGDDTYLGIQEAANPPKLLNGLSFGRFQGTTDADGNVEVDTGLTGFDAVICFEMNNMRPYKMWNVNTLNSPPTFVAKAVRTTDNVVAGAGVSVDFWWVVLNGRNL